MARYQISSKISGASLGTYEGRTAAEALDAMARDAGYADFAESSSASGDDGSHLEVREVHDRAYDPDRPIPTEY